MGKSNIKIDTRVFARYRVLRIDLINNTCTFLDGEGSDIDFDHIPIHYINLGMPLPDKILTFDDPHGKKDGGNIMRIGVKYEDFSVSLHNDPNNKKSFMEFLNVELLTPYNYDTRRFITWEEYDAEQQYIRKLMDDKSDFDQIVEYIQKMGREKAPKRQPMRASVYSEEGMTIYDYKFLARWHTQPEPTWGVFEEMKAYVFDDESRINIFMLRSGREIKDQTMYKWSLMFDQRGNMVVNELPVAYTLESSRPCADLAYFITMLAVNDKD